MVFLIRRTIVAIYGVNIVADSDINREMFKEVRLKLRLLFKSEKLRNIDESATTVSITVFSDGFVKPRY